MKCPLTWEALVAQSGEVKRPEQPCPHEMQELEEDVWSCPMHGRVVVDNLSDRWQDYIETIVAQNGKRRRLRRMFRRG